jgi:ATP-dependent Clp endopeptidase proteolytic subunit ClpP
MKFSYRNNKNAEAIAKYWGKSLDKPDWYKITNQDSGVPEVLIYDVVGWPFIDAEILVSELAEINNKDVLVRINSPGGDVFDGVAIFNALNAHKGNVVVRNEGLAASISSVIAMAGDERQSYPAAMTMIHNAWVLDGGNKEDKLHIADILGKIDENIVDIFFDRSNVGRPSLRKMMEIETWMTAKEAKEKGFIDTIIDGNAPKAAFDLSVFNHVPDGMSAEREGKDLTVREVERALRDAGGSISFAKSTAAGCSKGNQEEKELLEALNKLNERIN